MTLKFIHLKIDSKENNYLNLMICVNLKQISKTKNLNSTIVYLSLNASSKPKLYRSQSKVLPLINICKIKETDPESELLEPGSASLLG